MTDKLRPVPIGEIMTSDNPDEVLVVYGLGSCVVICLYDPVIQVGGILHALLPGLAWSNNSTNKPAKFVDRGIPVLIDALVALGAKSNRLTAQLCGGARMINDPGFNNTLNIGRRNVQAAQTALHAAGLELKAKAIGGRAGRTVKLYIADGRVTIKTLGQAERVLTTASQ
jgi:chemotaxis protein CheD